jgi:formate-dependent nitrite reductase membrane component NrfD
MIGWAEQYYSLLTAEGTSSSLAAKFVALGTGLVIAAIAIAILHLLRPWFEKRPSRF